jgi:aminoglycoside phosphotransferase (APT) family kinase protein
MHPDEVGTDAALVRRLLAAQFPAWAGLPVEPVFPRGTDNALYRIGDGMVARLPRRPGTDDTLRKECEWLPRLAPDVPFEVPVPLARGRPGGGYPYEWAVCRWLDGEDAAASPVSDVAQLAADLAKLVSALRHLDAAAGPQPGAHNFNRGEPLAARDEATRSAIAALAGTFDAPAMTAVWEAAVAAPVWERPPVWIHGDLDARNLIVREGRLTGVVDWGCLGVGDPATDVMVAWKLLIPEQRAAFRAALGVDDATWSRARGWAVSQAVVALSYYTEETNAVLVREAWRWLDAVLGE